MIVVIGAGFAGLSAAALLADAGRKVLVLDARPRLGGRATAFRDRDTGEIVDNGQHVMFGCYRETLAFLERVGALDNVRIQDALAIPFLDESGRRTELTCPPLPPPLHLLGGVLAWKALPFSDRVSALRLGPALLRARSGGVDPRAATETVAGWLQRYGQRPQLIEWLWEPLAVAALNQPIVEATAEPFVRVLAEMFGPSRRASALVMPAKPLDEMYVTPALRLIESRRGEVRTNALARVVAQGDRVSAVDIRGERVEAEAVISAVPWHQLRTLFQDVPGALTETVRNATAMGSMPIVTVNLWYDRVVMEDPFVGLPGRSMQWVFDKRRAFGEAASHLSLVSSAAATLSPKGNDELIALAAREIATSLPGAREARLIRGTVVREKQATFSLAAGQPPRPATITALKNFYLAGDWTDTRLPGTIESAVLSGHRAARAIIESA